MVLLRNSDDSSSMVVSEDESESDRFGIDEILRSIFPGLPSALKSSINPVLLRL